ncbi:MAG: lipoprotein LpqH [Mycolicibacterium sp.]|nr:lipoprotein LpqH [Mycolicibacterium sp.]
MHNRFAAAAGALAIAVLAGCSSPQLPNPPAAGVTINGSSALQTQAVHCTQVQWAWTINIGDAGSGANVNIDTSGQAPSTTSVHIHNVGGFSGIYSQGNGDADTRVSGVTFTITGTANGIHTETAEAASADYKIVARC